MWCKTSFFRAFIAVLLASAIQIASSAVILRIRLPSGVMQRLEVDDEAETIISMRERLIKDGILSAEDISFTLRGLSYSALSVSASLAEENATIKSLGVLSGDVLSIIRPAAPKEKRVIPDVEAATGSSEAVKVPKVITTKSNQKKPTSIADLEKKRKELLKITRQKGTGGRSVSMTSSAGRILHKIADTGGVAMLLGRIAKTTPQKAAAKKGTSIAAIAKLENAVKEKVEVLAVCELFQYSEEGSSSSLPENLCNLPAVAVFVQIAQSLGLSVVGCCVAMPKHLQVKEGKPVMWSSDHVFAALQLRSAVEASKEEKNGFIVLSVCKAVSEENVPANTPKKKALKRVVKPLVADGISLEAFQLSDQANLLHEKDILPMVRVRSKISTFSSYSAKTNAMKSIAMKALSTGSAGKGSDKSKDAAGEEDKIELTGEALIQTTEVTALDPFLLAVPLPIQPLKKTHTNTAASKSVKTKKITEIENTDPEFEHSFPSECEMKSDENTAKVAKLHFNRILAQLSLPGTKDRMRDPHFLYYVFKILDNPTRDALARSLMDGSDRFPGLVKVALDMVKMSLDTSRSDSNSVGRRSGRFIPDDDDDDDDA